MADIETINDMKDDEKLSALAERASQIASQIGSTTDPAALRGLAAEAQSLLSAVPIGANGSGSVISRIASVISEATSKEAAESEMEESPTSLGGSRGSMGRMSMEFQKAIYNQFMSSEERAYYDKFQAGTQYKMASIDENGNITEKLVDGKQATVDGAQLKEDFARVKAYSVDPEKDDPNGRPLTTQQKAALITSDGKRMAELTPAEEKNELKKLEKSLDNLEGQKAQELSEMGGGKEEAKRVRGSFMKARERVRELKNSLDDVEKARMGGLDSAKEQAEGTVRLKKRQLAKTLQEDVIDDALTGKKRGDRMGRDKDDIENEMVTPNQSKAGGVRAETEEAKRAADGEIMGAKDDGKTPEKTTQITGGQNIDRQDIANLSPAAAGGTTRSTSREMS
ncbi:MAG: hypothetical protein ACK502_06100 [Alphaproteobacteria bacterium]